MTEFFTWATLIIFACTSTATALITQLFKRVFQKFPQQLLTYGIALVILVVIQIITGELNSWQSAVITVLQALLCAFAATGEYEAVKKICKK